MGQGFQELIVSGGEETEVLVEVLTHTRSGKEREGRHRGWWG